MILQFIYDSQKELKIPLNCPKMYMFFVVWQLLITKAKIADWPFHAQIEGWSYVYWMQDLEIF